MSTKQRTVKEGKKDLRNPLAGESKDGIAHFITNTFGSLAFLCVFVVFVLGWIIWKGSASFNSLELFLAVFAIFLSIMVLISQKRQARLEKINEQVEFEINLRAEKEITKVLEMLKEIQEKLGIKHEDPALDKMVKDLDTKKLHNEHKKADKNR